MKKRLLNALYICWILLLVGSPALAEQCVIIEDDLSMEITCAMYDGIGYAFRLDYHVNPADPDNFFWKMDLSSFGMSTGGPCIAVNSDLSMNVTCAEFMGRKYGFMLVREFNPSDPSELCWKIEGNICVQPGIQAIDPAMADAGELALLFGSNFGDMQGSVLFTPGVAAEIVSWADEVIVVTVPADAETGNVTVISYCGQASTGCYFVVGPLRGTIDVYVSASIGNNSWDGSAARPWKTIQHAVDQTDIVASPACLVNINVAAGIYTENIEMGPYHSLLGGFSSDFLSRITADPEEADSTAIIDGSKHHWAVWVRGSSSLSEPTTVISGFSIRNGTVGIYCESAPTMISNNTIKDNLGPGIVGCGPVTGNLITDNMGSGIANCRGSVRHNSVLRNTAAMGGGIFNCTGDIIDNRISGNKAHEGGGIHSCDGLIKRNIVSDNISYNGAGLYVCSGTITDNTITFNRADWLGGGIYGCNGDISHNRITENTAGYQGGGLFDCDGETWNNMILGNRADAGGGLARCDGRILSNTISDNKAEKRGGGAYLCGARMEDNIITANWSGGDGGGIYRPLDRVDGGSISGNHAVGLGGGVAYEYGVTIATPVSSNTCDQRPTLIDCKTGLWDLLQDVDNSYVLMFPWFICYDIPSN